MCLLHGFLSESFRRQKLMKRRIISMCCFDKNSIRYFQQMEDMPVMSDCWWHQTYVPNVKPLLILDPLVHTMLMSGSFSCSRLISSFVWIGRHSEPSETSALFCRVRTALACCSFDLYIIDILFRHFRHGPHFNRFSILSHSSHWQFFTSTHLLMASQLPCLVPGRCITSKLFYNMYNSSNKADTFYILVNTRCKQDA